MQACTELPAKIAKCGFDEVTIWYSAYFITDVFELLRRKLKHVPD